MVSNRHSVNFCTKKQILKIKSLILLWSSLPFSRTNLRLWPIMYWWYGLHLCISMFSNKMNNAVPDHWTKHLLLRFCLTEPVKQLLLWLKLLLSLLYRTRNTIHPSTPHHHPYTHHYSRCIVSFFFKYRDYALLLSNNASHSWVSDATSWVVFGQRPVVSHRYAVVVSLTQAV